MVEEKKKRERKKSGFFGKFISAFLGFTVGVVATVGGIGGAGYYIATQVPIKDSIDTVGNMTGSNMDYRDFVTEEFASNTIVSAFGEVGELMKEVSAGTASLSSLERFSPLVRNKIAELLPKLAELGVTIDIDELMSTSFPELPTYLLEVVDKTEIGKIASSYSGSLGDGILKLLSYGEENFEYVMEDVDGDGSADVSMLGNNKPTVVGDLKSGDLFDGPLAHISLTELIKNGGSNFADDIIFRTVLFGEEGVDYVMINDTVQMLPRVFAFSADTFKDMESGLLYKRNGSAWTNANGYVISATSGEYAYVVTDDNGEVVEKLKTTAIPNAYEVYRFSELGTEVKQLRRGLTIGDLINDGLNTTDLLNKIAIGDLLKLHAGSESMLLTIAYGQEGIDYEIVNGEIVPITEPTKIGDLLNTDTLMEKLYGFYLADVLDISPIGADEEDLMFIQLAYGEEGVHYKLVDTNEDGTPDEIKWMINLQTGQPYGKRTLGDLASANSDIFNSLSIASILNVKYNSDPLLLNLAYGASSRYDIVGTEIVMKPIVYTTINGVIYDDMNNPYDGADGNGSVTLVQDGVYKISNWKETYYISQDGNLYYAYATADDAAAGLEETRLHYQKHLLSSLRGGEAHLFIDEIELGSALGLKPTDSDRLMVALAFGYEGEHFDVNDGVVTWRINPNTGLPYRPRTLKDLNDMQSIIQSIKLADFFGSIAQNNPLLSTFVEKDWSIADLTSENINGLKLGEVLEISTDSGILYALRESTIGGLDAAIKGLTITDLLGEQCKNHMFLKHLATTPLEQVPTAMNNLTIVQVFADSVYKPNTNQLTGCWKYMLTDRNGILAPEDYTLTDFDELMKNMSVSMEKATLQELANDGVLTFNNISLTQSRIMGVEISTLTGDPTKTTLGDLSLLDLLTVVVNNQNFPAS